MSKRSFHFKNKIAQLDVGGTLYKVSRDTLERCEGSMLASLISDHWKEASSDEPIFIDRNGRLFEYVLDYLRTDKVYLPLSVNPVALEEEFRFYGIYADMSKVFQTAPKCFDLFLERADEIRMEKLADQTAALACHEMKRCSILQIPPADYLQFLGKHGDDALHDRLRDKGMKLVAREWMQGEPYIKVEPLPDL